MLLHDKLLIDLKILNKTVRQYETLHFPHELIDLLKNVFPAQCFSNWKKYELHQTFNSLILSHYPGEEVIKYALFKTFRNKNNIGAFEIRVNNSRADFVCINGYSSSFEIKSQLDNLAKLGKQASDYEKAFDYNFIVIDEKHLLTAKRLIPRSFGIWSFSNRRKIVHREPKLNKAIDPLFQLQLLTKKERITGFGVDDGNFDKIYAVFSASEINHRFKDLLKRRYRQRWSFLTTHADQILPIDLQFFFNTNIHPDIIYKD